jgi:hypothetical protein
MKTSSKILLFGFLGVSVMCALFCNITLGHTVEKWGAFGDKFNVLNTLFTGLAFVGLVAALWHDRESGEEQKIEQDRLLAATIRQAIATERLIELQANVALLEFWRGRWKDLQGFPEQNEIRVRIDACVTAVARLS